MKKTICDVCGKEMPTFKNELPPGDVQFCISSYGHIWDVCDECRKELNNWISQKKGGVKNEEILF